MKSLIAKLLLLSCVVGLTLTSCDDNNSNKKHGKRKKSAYSFSQQKYDAKCQKCNKKKQRYNITGQSMQKVGKTSRSNSSYGTR